LLQDYWNPVGFDFWCDDDYWVWGMSVHNGANRWVQGMTLDLSTAALSGVALGRATSTAWIEDVEIAEDTDGTLHVVGCETSLGYVSWLHGTPAELYAGTASAWDTSQGNSDACATYIPNGELVVGYRTGSALRWFAYNDASGLTYTAVSLGYDAYDIETAYDGSQDTFAMAMGSAGVYFGDTYAAWTLTGFASATQVDFAYDSAGTVYILAEDNGTDAWLLWGTTSVGFQSTQIAHGLASLDDLAVTVTADDRVVVALRGGNSVQVMAVSAP
jgi:hypothetical protein